MPPPGRGIAAMCGVHDIFRMPATAGSPPAAARFRTRRAPLPRGVRRRPRLQRSSSRNTAPRETLMTNAPRGSARKRRRGKETFRFPRWSGSAQTRMALIARNGASPREYQRRFARHRLACSAHVQTATVNPRRVRMSAIGAPIEPYPITPTTRFVSSMGTKRCQWACACWASRRGQFHGGSAAPSARRIAPFADPAADRSRGRWADAQEHPAWRAGRRRRRRSRRRT